MGHFRHHGCCGASACDTCGSCGCDTGCGYGYSGGCANGSCGSSIGGAYGAPVGVTGGAPLGAPVGGPAGMPKAGEQIPVAPKEAPGTPMPKGKDKDSKDGKEVSSIQPAPALDLTPPTAPKGASAPESKEPF